MARPSRRALGNSYTLRSPRPKSGSLTATGATTKLPRLVHTQLVMAGLAAARGVFLDNNDAARSATLDQLTLNTRNAYAANGQAEVNPLSPRNEDTATG